MANYIREPYSADLDFGTGEWTASAWVNNGSRLGGDIATRSSISGPSISLKFQRITSQPTSICSFGQDVYTFCAYDQTVFHHIDTGSGLIYDNAVSIPNIGLPTAAFYSIVTPNGKFVYLLGQNAGTWIYLRDSVTGRLTYLSYSSIFLGYRFATISSDSKFLYSNDEYMAYCYSIDSNTGALTRIQTITSGSRSGGLAISSDGLFFYQTSHGGVGDLRTYSRDTYTGIVTLINTISLSYTDGGTGLLSPDGKFFIVGSHYGLKVYTYARNTSTGLLTYSSESSTFTFNVGVFGVTNSYVYTYGYFGFRQHPFDPVTGIVSTQSASIGVGGVIYVSSDSVAYTASSDSSLTRIALAPNTLSSLPYVLNYVYSDGKLVATASDGVTTRTVTTDAAYNTGSWIKAEATYRSGKLAILVNGVEVKSTVGAPLLSLNSRYNLLTYTEQFNTSAWTTYGATSKSGITTLTAVYGTGDCQVYQMISAPPAGQYRFSIQARSSANTTFTFRFGYALSTAKSIVGDNTWQTFTHDFTGAGNETYFVLLSNNSTIEFRYPEIKLTAQSAFPYQRVGAATDFDFQAPLTIGNSYDLTAPFPGSLALVKLSATVPTAEQAQWMYEQEKMMFQPNAQVTLPDLNAIQDLAYDDLTDRWITSSAANVSCWNGLVRTSVTPVSAGAFSRLASGAGHLLTSRTTTNAGVDITLTTSSVTKQLLRSAEPVTRSDANLVVFDYVGGFTANTAATSTLLTSVAGLSVPPGVNLVGAQITGTGIPASTTIVDQTGAVIAMSTAATATGTSVQVSFTDFPLPTGYTANAVSVAGVVKQEGASATWSRLYDGFRETVRFGTAPGYNTWVQIQATKSIS